jgi:K+-transporting ATPase A subunit
MHARGLTGLGQTIAIGQVASPTFVVFLIGVVILLALLTFVTMLFLGPLVQGLTSHVY